MLTADLWDAAAAGTLASCSVQLRSYGARVRFSGTVSTVRCHEDNVLLKEAISEPGNGRVLVVDGGGSLGSALLGDNLAALAAGNGWEGLVIHGCVRDVAALASVDLGIRAVGSNPRRSAKDGVGERDVPVSFGGAVFAPGATVTVDEDGVVVTV